MIHILPLPKVALALHVIPCPVNSWVVIFTALLSIMIPVDNIDSGHMNTYCIRPGVGTGSPDQDETGPGSVGLTERVLHMATPN